MRWWNSKESKSKKNEVKTETRRGKQHTEVNLHPEGICGPCRPWVLDFMASWIVGTGRKAQGLQNRMWTRKQPLSPLRQGEPCRYVIIARLSRRSGPSPTASPGTWLLSKPGMVGRGACLRCVLVLTRRHHVDSQLEWQFPGSPYIPSPENFAWNGSGLEYPWNLSRSKCQSSLEEPTFVKVSPLGSSEK